MLFCLLTVWIYLYKIIYKGILRNDICFITDCCFKLDLKKHGRMSMDKLMVLQHLPKLRICIFCTTKRML